MCCGRSDISVYIQEVNEAHFSSRITRSAPVTTVDPSDTGTEDTVVRIHCFLHYQMIQVRICPEGVEDDLYRCRC